MVNSEEWGVLAKSKIQGSERGYQVSVDNASVTDSESGKGFF